MGYESGAGRMVGLELGGDGGFDVGGGHGRGCFGFWEEGTLAVWFGGHGQVFTGSRSRYYGSRTSYVRITLDRYTLPYPTLHTCPPSESSRVGAHITNKEPGGGPRGW